MRLPILGAICLSAIFSSAALAADVEVTLTGVREGGDLFVGLQDREQFMGPTDNGKTITAPAGGTATITLTDIVPGEYAIVVWHDDNQNGQFDAGEPGRPPFDGWALSNFENPTGPPQFDQVKVTVGPDGGKFRLPMNYGR